MLVTAGASTPSWIIDQFISRLEAFDAEPQPMRDAYGPSSGFGQGCLLARRLVQAGVRFVEVQLGGWDTHQNNFETVQTKSAELDTRGDPHRVFGDGGWNR